MKKRLLIPFISLLLSQSLAAQTVTMNLEQCLATAAEQSPAMRMSRLEVEKARLLQHTAFDAPMTGISLTQETTCGDSPDNGLNFSQEFDFPTVYVARHKALKAETEVARRTMDITSASLERDITSCYWSLVHACHRLRHIERADSVYSGFLRLTEERHAKGEISRLDVISARQIKSRCDLDLREARDQRDALSLQLQALTGAELPVSVPDTVTLCPLDAPAADVYDFDSSLQGRLTLADEQLQRRNVTLARNEFAPGLSLSATTRMLIKSFNPYDVEREPFKGHFMKFEVGVSVPLFFGAKRARARAADRDLQLSRLRREQQRVESANEYLAAVTELRTASENLSYYSTSATAEADEMERLAEVSYRLGEINENDCLQYYQTVTDVRLARADAVNRYNQAVINLNYLKK